MESEQHLKTDLIEFLIPLTIFVTAVSNLFRKEESIGKKNVQINYVFALFFGLIHGMGFSNYLRALLGKSHNILSPLLAFNLGLELGQIIVVTIFLVISYILVDLVNVQRRDWKMVLSSAIAGIAFILMKDRIFF
ncbi:MAG: HupE/UreJ family protein [Cyclobacteriaceae bacterium]